MEPQPEKLREQAERAKWWARSTPDPIDRDRLGIVARDYEKMAEAAERLLRTWVECHAGAGRRSITGIILLACAS